MVKTFLASLVFFSIFSAVYTFTREAYAEAQTAPPGDDSACTPIRQQIGRLKLVGVEIDLETEEATAAYFEAKDPAHALLHILVRPSCQAAFAEVKVVPLTRETSAPEDSSTQKL